MSRYLLKDSQKNLKEHISKLLFQRDKSIVFVLHNGRLVASNEAFLEFFKLDSIEDSLKNKDLLSSFLRPSQNSYAISSDKELLDNFILKDSDEKYLHDRSMKKTFLVSVSQNKSLELCVVSLHEVTSLFTKMQYYEFGTKSSNIGIWDWNLEEGSIFFSTQWKKMLGYDDHELPNKLETWSKLIHPDDVENALSDIQKNQNAQTKSYINQHRLRHKDGRWIWILDKGETFFDKDGKAVRMIGTHNDISDIKAYEQSQKFHKKRSDVLLKLPSIAEGVDEKRLIELAQNYAKDLTNSSCSFLHFVDQKQKSTELTTWSDQNVRNDIIIPVVENKKVVMLAGVGNKIQDYSDIDVETLKLIANTTWRIAQRKRTIKKLKDQKYLFDTTQKIAKIASWEWSVKQDKLIGSKEFYLLTGLLDNTDVKYTLEDYSKMIDHEYVDLFYSSIKGTLDNNSNCEIGYKFKNAKGEEIFLLQKSEAKLNSKKEKKIFGTIQDITKNKEMENELKQKENMIISQSRHAAMGEMMGLIAHQWRQPISVVTMGINNILVDLELDSLNQETLKEELENISEQTQKLSKTIDDFRNFFKSDSKKTTFTLDKITQDVRYILKASLENHSISLICNHKDEISLNTYKHELMQVILNIMNNSKEALVKNDVKDKKIRCSSYKEEDFALISICDNAGGVTQQNINKIFEPYFSSKSELQNVGMGLYISKTIVQNHLGGLIEAYNKKDGLCIDISIPISLK